MKEANIPKEKHFKLSITNYFPLAKTKKVTYYIIKKNYIKMEEIEAQMKKRLLRYNQIASSVLIFTSIIVLQTNAIYAKDYERKKIDSISAKTGISSLTEFEDMSELKITTPEFTEEYKAWLELPEDKRKEYIEPDHYGVPYYTTLDEQKNEIDEQEGQNILQRAVRYALRKSQAKAIPSSYDLSKRINITVKDQKKASSCWAFSATSMLESNINLKTRNYIRTFFT